jgi:hypothetical protein
MAKETRLTIRELASLDAVITAAQARGLTLADRVTKMTDYTEALIDVHHGIEISRPDREILGRMRELASQLEMAPTLSQLIEARGEAVRQLSRS